MEDENMLMEVLKQYQKKYNAVSEIHRLTEEMGQLLSHNDRVSVQLVLKMRQDEMNQSDKCDTSIALLKEAMTPNDGRQFERLLEHNANPNIAENFEEKKLMEIAENIRLAFEKTVELDKRISSRIAGKDSYYSEGR